MFDENRFNVSETIESTGRSINDNRPVFSFPLQTNRYSPVVVNDRNFRTMPLNHRSDHEPRIVYASSPINRKIPNYF